MTRSYRLVRAKRDRVYAVEDVLKLYSICRNTLTNWKYDGLRTVDDKRPELYRGAELIRFHDDRALKYARKLRKGEFKCLSCKAVVTPLVETVSIQRSSDGAVGAWAQCPDCAASMVRFLDAPTCDAYEACIKSNTSLRTLDEGYGLTPAGIGTNATVDSPRWNAQNERIVYSYQLYAGRYSDKTLDAHLAAIRDFERFTNLKSLSTVTPADAARYRSHLVARADAGYSRSTIRHRASFLTQFFSWLVKQHGYRRMNQTIADNFKLSKQNAAMAIQPKPRLVPTLEQVFLILRAMPTKTRVNRRDQAGFAASFLFGTRASATASLLLCHIDIEGRRVMQDATQVRVKNSKSQTTVWFPIDERFERIIVSWIAELRAMGFNDDDPLLPPDEAFQKVRPGKEHLPIKPWATADGIRRAFKRGCEAAGLPYLNPHSARHFLAAMANICCRSPEERAAWSYNLGQSRVITMEVNYNKMTDARRDRAFEVMGQRDPTPEDQLRLLMRYHDRELDRGSPEFDEAEALWLQRMGRRKR